MDEQQGDDEKRVEYMTSMISTKLLTKVTQIISDHEKTGTVVDFSWRKLKTWENMNVISLKDDGARFDGCKFLIGLHPNLPVNTMLNMISSNDGEACFGLARNPNATSQVLILLRGHEDQTIRFAVVANPNVHVEALQVYDNDSFSVLKEIVNHADTPVDVLLGFVSHDNVELLRDLMCHPNLPVEVSVDIFLRVMKSGQSKRFKETLLNLIPVKVLALSLKEKYPEVGGSMPRAWLVSLWEAERARF